MLVKFRVHIEEVDPLNIDLVHVLVDGVARGDSDVSVQLEAWVSLISDALLVVSVLPISLQVVLYGEFPFKHSELEVNGATIERVYQTMIVGGC